MATDEDGDRVECNRTPITFSGGRMSDILDEKMILKVRVLPNSKEESIEEREGVYKIKVREKAIGGKANAAMIELIAERFNVKKSEISIIKGGKSRDKVVRIDV